VKLTALLLSKLLVVTTTFPVVAPIGTTAVMLELVQEPIVADMPLNVRVPCVAPKFEPETTTPEPTGPRAGVRAVMLGGNTTEKTRVLLAVPPELVTMTLPLVAPAGTETRIPVGVQLGIDVAFTPLKLTDPLSPPRLEPAMKTKEPNKPEFGDKSVITGGTVNNTPLLVTPPAAVTTMLPVLAPLGTVTAMLLSLQEPMVAVLPPNLTLRLVVLGPKFDPEMVTDVPAAPLAGEMSLIAGGGTTVNGPGLVAVRPAAVVRAVS
jgi:hypothetical protein